LPDEWLSSVQEDWIAPFPFSRPLQIQSAVIPLAVLFTFESWHSLWAWGMGPPYLSIMSWVRHTTVVWGAAVWGVSPGPCVTPPNGDCCQVVLEVTSHSPGFLPAWAAASIEAAHAQPANPIQNNFECTIPPACEAPVQFCTSSE
jgi:hypothetical protein